MREGSLAAKGAKHLPRQEPANPKGRAAKSNRQLPLGLPNHYPCEPLPPPSVCGPRLAPSCFCFVFQLPGRGIDIDGPHCTAGADRNINTKRHNIGLQHIEVTKFVELPVLYCKGKANIIRYNKAKLEFIDNIETWTV